MKTFKKIINEILIGYMNPTTFRNSPQDEFEVYKNPKSIKNFVPYARGLTTPDYDFYIVDDA